MVAEHAIADFFQRGLQARQPLRGSSVGHPYQDNARRMRYSLPEDQLAKAIVFGDQNAPLAHSKRQNETIFGRRVCFQDREHIVSAGSKRCDGQRRDAFVYDDAHQPNINSSLTM